MFYVSQYIEEWEYDIGNILENRQLCYVKNLDMNLLVNSVISVLEKA